MAKERSRSQAETRFQKFQRTDQESKSVVETERDAVRKKTAGLKALRMAKESAEATEIGKRPAVRKTGKPKPAE